VDELTRSLKLEALACGFDLVGVAEAGPARSAPVLQTWLEAGMHGEMEYLRTSAPARADPARLLPGCRSVIAVAMSYHTSLPASNDAFDPDRAWVSRYAWGRDYHRVLKGRLLRLGRWLEIATGSAGWRAGVDTLPVLEREWAARAGLGWLGKNTQLINRRFGTELFLGVLLSDVTLVPDPPASAHCGRCTACLDACPTGALVAPGRLDARRCIAYLTVEHRGGIEPDLAGHLGGMVAGCDICQEVCPWNRGAPADLHPEFQPAAGRHRPRLSELLALDEEGYRRWRAGSALTRIPYHQMRRNLELAAARARNPREAPPNSSP
jgi:epoxyqueuosine reductase